MLRMRRSRDKRTLSGDTSPVRQGGGSADCSRWEWRRVPLSATWPTFCDPGLLISLPSILHSSPSIYNLVIQSNRLMTAPYSCAASRRTHLHYLHNYRLTYLGWVKVEPDWSTSLWWLIICHCTFCRATKWFQCLKVVYWHSIELGSFKKI